MWILKKNIQGLITKRIWNLKPGLCGCRFLPFLLASAVFFPGRAASLNECDGSPHPPVALQGVRVLVLLRDGECVAEAGSTLCLYHSTIWTKTKIYQRTWVIFLTNLLFFSVAAGASLSLSPSLLELLFKACSHWKYISNKSLLVYFPFYISF